MTLNEARATVYNRFVTEWADETPYYFDGEGATVGSLPNNVPWVRLSVRNRIARQDSYGVPGNRKFLREASAIVQVFFPINAGLTIGDQLCEKVACIFTGITIDKVWFLTAQVSELGQDGTWYRMNVETEFKYEEIR